MVFKVGEQKKKFCRATCFEPSQLGVYDATLFFYKNQVILLEPRLLFFFQHFEPQTVLILVLTFLETQFYKVM